MTIITKTIIRELLYYYYLLHAVICQSYAQNWLNQMWRLDIQKSECQCRQNGPAEQITKVFKIDW